MQQTSGHKARFIDPIMLTSKMTIFFKGQWPLTLGIPASVGGDDQKFSLR